MLSKVSDEIQRQVASVLPGDMTGRLEHSGCKVAYDGGAVLERLLRQSVLRHQGDDHAACLEGMLECLGPKKGQYQQWGAKSARNQGHRH